MLEDPFVIQLRSNPDSREPDYCFAMACTSIL
jgi:hypothetical protein